MNDYSYQPDLNGSETPPPPRYDYLYGEEKKQGVGFAIASLVLGICSLLCCCLWYVSLACGALAVAFAIINKKHAGEMNGMALAGLVCGIVGAVIGIMIFAYSLVLSLTNPSWLEEFYNSSLETATILLRLFH